MVSYRLGRPDAGGFAFVPGGVFFGPLGGSLLRLCDFLLLRRPSLLLLLPLLAMALDEKV